MNRLRVRCRRPRGTSLVEALVAMAVMAIGMLAVVGVQSTLRLNADVAKQRSEAVRIAQEAMESARGFAVIETPAEGQTAYASTIDGAARAVEGYTTNTTFVLTQSVVTHADAARKDIRIRVEWTDRSGQAQGVELSSVVGANDPRLALLLGARPNGIPVRQPLGRHPGIPPGAKAVSPSLSVFKPPAPGGQVVWVFDNLSGVIVGVCNTITTGQADLTEADISSCINDTYAQLLRGFVRFAGGSVAPNAAEAENPSGTALNLGVGIMLTSSGHPTPNHVCYAQAPTSQATAESSFEVSYYCAVFSNGNGLWSGRSSLVPLAFAEEPSSPWQLADDAADVRAERYRVCRYTPASSDTQPVPNRDHPRTYVDVKTPLLNQNFLVIRAGDGDQAYGCPTDVPANPAAGDLVNSNTLVHQPPPG
jgi:Tfp pilus assembly protein PilV